MRLFAALAIVALCYSTAVGADESCREFSGSVPHRLDSSLDVGDYELVLVAADGSRKGNSAHAVVHLRKTSADDRSPRTGEKADDSGWSETPLYGWIDGDLAVVGAPMCDEGPHPAPDSRDPIYPGVLVHYMGGFLESPRQPEDAPVILIGTLSNLRNGEHWVDGCGIGLFVLQNNGGTFVGRWEAWGIRRDGSGYFCLRQR